MKKAIYVLFMAFLFVSCGESHHQITGSVDYSFEGDSVIHTIPFQYDNCDDWSMDDIEFQLRVDFSSPKTMSRDECYAYISELTD